MAEVFPAAGVTVTFAAGWSDCDASAPDPHALNSVPAAIRAGINRAGWRRDPAYTGIPPKQNN
ncbi:hypothetical protein HOK021_52190 [Streptomyces hygroscopicus]|nr:hypothetical protein HOK021_52190 [Streptomyces hygroscopicus]